MLISDLKKILNDLPPECDSFKVEILSKVIPLADGHWAREDHPVFGSITDQTNGEFLLADEEQLKLFTSYAQQNSNPGRDPAQHLSTLGTDSGGQDRR